MAIPTTTVVGLGCPTCGDVDVYRMSVFLFNKHQTVLITCNCGTNLLALNAKDYKRFRLQVQCSICDQPHIFLLNRGQIWGRRVFPLYCRATGREIGVLGPEVEVHDGLDLFLNRVNWRIFGTDTVASFSQNPILGYRLIDHISQMAKNEKIYCHCGQLDLEVEVFPDKIRLYCERCGAWSIIQICPEAENQDFSCRDQIRLIWGDPVEGQPSQTRNKRNL
jgi:predicted RNA-binding Zn-ribbon protein involved in translation (DUF1610 family)